MNLLNKFFSLNHRIGGITMSYSYGLNIYLLKCHVSVF